MARLTIFMAARWSSSQVCCYCSWIGLVRVCSFDRLPHFARGLQGIGAAFLAPGSLAIISASYTEYELGQPVGPGLASGDHGRHRSGSWRLAGRLNRSLVSTSPVKVAVSLRS
jgi:hypothetical protein